MSEPAIAAPNPAGGGLDETTRVPGWGEHGGAGHIELAPFARPVRECAAPPNRRARLGAHERDHAPVRAVRCALRHTGGSARFRARAVAGGGPRSAVSWRACGTDNPRSEPVRSSEGECDYVCAGVLELRFSVCCSVCSAGLAAGRARHEPPRLSATTLTVFGGSWWTWSDSNRRPLQCH